MRPNRVKIHMVKMRPNRVNEAKESKINYENYYLGFSSCLKMLLYHCKSLEIDIIQHLII